MPQPQPGVDRPAEGDAPTPDRGREPAATGQPPVPPESAPRTGPDGTLELPADQAGAPTPPEPAVTGEAGAPTPPEPATGEAGASAPPEPAVTGQAGTSAPDRADASSPEPAPADRTAGPARREPADAGSTRPATTGGGIEDRTDGSGKPTSDEPTGDEPAGSTPVGGDGPPPTRIDPPSPPAPPAPTRVDAAPRWSGSAAVPPPPPRPRAWGESAEPTPVPPVPSELPEHRTPVDPWAGADTGGWELDHPDLTPLPPTVPYPAPPQTRPYPAAPPPTRSYPAPPAHPSYPPPPVAARPVSPPPAPVSPPTRIAPPPPPPPVAPARPPKQRRGRREPVAPPPGWQAPKGYVPVPVRRRRRWPWVLLLSLACCCGCPAWFGKPVWEQYPAKAALPGQVADLSLREDDRSRAAANRLKTEVREANLLAEDVFAGVYSTPDGKRVTVFGDTGFRISPESDADDTLARLTETYQLGAVQQVDTGVRGRYERCAVGSSDGGDVVVCASVDHGSSATAVFTRLSVDDSARLLATLRDQIITAEQG